MCCSMLQCVAVRCSVLQYDVCRKYLDVETHANQEKCQAEKIISVMCSSALKCVAVCCSVLQCNIYRKYLAVETRANQGKCQAEISLDRCVVTP